jgi:hypothetical protein
MMKKIIMIAAAMYSLTTLAFYDRDVLVEIKGSGFFPTSHLFKKIYHTSGMVGAEATVNLYDCIYGWASIDWLSKSGHSLIADTKTKVNYLPIAFGLKYFIPFPFCYGDWYVGIGALAARIHTHDFSPFVAPYYTKWGWGVIAKAGVLFDISCSFFIDFFLNYSSVNARSTNTFGGLVVPHKAKVHGWILGAGLGYRF